MHTLKNLIILIMSKIFITGVSGIGKTTLAEYISKRMQIPFVVGSSTILWEKYGIKNHLDILKMGLNDPKKGLDFQLELLSKRFELSNEHQHFVTDRSPIDNAVYFLLQNSQSLKEEQVESYIQKCWDYFHNTPYCQIIYLSHKTGLRTIEDDSKRITNPYFQNDVVGPIFENFINQTKAEFDNKLPNPISIKDENKYAKIYTIKDWDWKKRIDAVDLILS